MLEHKQPHFIGGRTPRVVVSKNIFPFSVLFYPLSVRRAWQMATDSSTHPRLKMATRWNRIPDIVTLPPSFPVICRGGNILPVLSLRLLLRPCFPHSTAYDFMIAIPIMPHCRPPSHHPYISLSDQIVSRCFAQLQSEHHASGKWLCST